MEENRIPFQRWNVPRQVTLFAQLLGGQMPDLLYCSEGLGHVHNTVTPI